jgi:hypothetical protein
MKEIIRQKIEEAGGRKKAVGGTETKQSRRIRRQERIEEIILNLEILARFFSPDIQKARNLLYKKFGRTKEEWLENRNAIMTEYRAQEALFKRRLASGSSNAIETLKTSLFPGPEEDLAFRATGNPNPASSLD